MRDAAHRLHWLSWIFVAGASVKEFAIPLLAFVVLGKREGNWALWGGALAIGFAAWTMLSAFSYRYRIGERELLIREGVLDRTERHIPFSNIQGVNQRRKLLHRLLGVTELHLESAVGGKPEAVMKVLGLAAAHELEALLHAARAGDAAHAHGAPAPSPVLHRLDAAEIVRLGLVSNRALVVLGVLFGLLMQNNGTRQFIIEYAHVPIQWLGARLLPQVASGHWSMLVLAGSAALAATVLILCLLSVLLAFFKYYDFTLELDGEKLMVRHGLLSTVRASARLPRLQSWLLDESWLLRRIGRVRLAVVTTGAAHEHEHGLDPGASLNELAPIATRAQALKLLKTCLPTLNWDDLAWQPLHHSTVKRRLIGQARWVVPLVLALVLVDVRFGWPIGALAVVGAVVSVGLAMWCHARAWATFAAYAEAGDVLLFRHGVWHKRWVVVVSTSLQSLRLYSSPLDRQLGIVHLQADIQGGSRHHRVLDIACVGLAEAQVLRSHLWRRIQAPISTPLTSKI